MSALLGAAVLLTRLALVGAVLLALVRLLSPAVARHLSYGKLASATTTSFSLSTRTAWIAFYSFASTWTLLLIIFSASLPSRELTIGGTTFSYMFLFQGIRRTLESASVHRFSDRRLPVSLFVAGLLFYAITPLSIVLELVEQDTKDTLFNSIINGVCVISAVLLFVNASSMQTRAHKALASLREDGSQNAYRIPFGGDFDSVSCPHYFAEILIYLSFVLVTRCSLHSLYSLHCSICGNSHVHQPRPRLCDAQLGRDGTGHPRMVSVDIPDLPQNEKATYSSCVLNICTLFSDSVTLIGVMEEETSLYNK